MAKTKISEYDSTAANNTDIDSINIAEGMAPSNVNNAIRQLMAHLNTEFFKTGSNNTSLGDGALDSLDGSSPGGSNVAVGKNAGTAITTGNNNTFVGAFTGDVVTTGTSNTALGFASLSSCDVGNHNTAVGNGTLNALNYSSSTDGYNTAIGSGAGETMTTGTRNTLIGGLNGDAITTGGSNVAIGYASLTTDTLGSRSVAVGQGALFSQNFTTATNSYNVGIGYETGGAITTAIKNTLIGSLAGDALTTGSNNTIVGYEAATSLTTGGQNTLIGWKTGASLTTGVSNTFVGCPGQNNNCGSLITTGSDNTIIGAFDGNQGGLDIRTSSNNIVLSDGDGNPRMHINSSGTVVFNEGGISTADFRIESDANANIIGIDAGNNAVGLGKFGATGGAAAAGAYFADSSFFHFVIANESASSIQPPMFINRQSSDGQLIQFRQADAMEGTISVSGSTVSYNGFSGRHESSGIPTNTPVGTVVSTIDELDVYPDTTIDTEGNTIPHKKAGQTRADHAKVEVSTSEGDACVYGVVSEFDGDGKVIVTSVGIGSIRVTGACAKGDLLESNGDGTAKVQSDDIIRSKTIGKVTIGNSNTGVKLVSCVMYCG